MLSLIALTFAHRPGRTGLEVASANEKPAGIASGFRKRDA